MTERIIALHGRGRGPSLVIKKHPASLDVEGLKEGEHVSVLNDLSFGDFYIVSENGRHTLPGYYQRVSIQYLGGNPHLSCFLRYQCHTES